MLAEEKCKNVALTNKLEEIEVNLATVTSALNQEKLHVIDTKDKLSKEEANHLATKNVLEHGKQDFDQMKVQLELEMQSHAFVVALLQQEINNLKEMIEKFNRVEEDNSTLRSDLLENQEKCQNVQKELEVEQENGRIAAELAKSLQGKLEDEFKKVKNLRKSLDDAHSNSKQIQQSLDLAQQENSSLRSEVMKNQEICQNIQKELEAEQANSRKTSDFAISLQEKLDSELKRVENLGKTLDNEHASLKQMQQSLNLAQQEKDAIKVSNSINGLWVMHLLSKIVF